MHSVFGASWCCSDFNKLLQWCRRAVTTTPVMNSSRSKLGPPETGVGPLQEDMVPDGISRFLLCVISERGGGLGKTERGSGPQLEGRKREVQRREAGLTGTKTTPARRKRASQRKADSRLKPTKHVKGKGKKNKWEGFAKASLSHVKDDAASLFTALFQALLGSLLSETLLLRASSRGLNRRDGGGSRFQKHVFLQTHGVPAAFLFLFCFCGFTPITWMTSASRQT